MVIVFDVLARLPLWLLHRIGTLLGWVVYLSSGRYARRLRANLQSAGLADSRDGYRKLVRANVSEAGKGIMELPWVWRRPLEKVLTGVKQYHGWEHIEAAVAQGKGVIALTPHLGCFEIISLFIAARLPITTMYRPPRWAFLDKLMYEGRARGQTKLAPTDLGGVRQLIKTLKHGGIIGVLPDQVPGNGEGEWVPFFGRPAYTMTLIGKLIKSSGAAVVMCSSERLPHGEGYALHFTPLAIDPAISIPAQINAVLEKTIRTCPEQYLWSYNRYKVPRGALPPDTVKEQ
ncbi:lysophospholipid acyltransferase family protein [Sideroxydans lithotrophicus]|uniref:Lipid A biosynthesis acyltransferase n=1 Tax=Sideroxydans lithotrophicus (strain ES-1) TaxID=580332 RepID=D5CU85_SIDLE|nr:lysophospholipid acyltransferase family protein [Sideroxydans lithotrophicus]ADE10420.1 lipid A biosynthesis acyltransferase [Sideroxydans lithotrophicus ES-1]